MWSCLFFSRLASWLFSENNVSREWKISERHSMFFVDDLREICQMYYDRVYLCEGQKWDLEREVRKRDYEVQEINKRKQQKKKKEKNKRWTMRGEREQPPAARFFCATPLWMSLFALSLVVPPSFCTYTYVSIWVLFSLSFTMFLLENTLSGFSTTRNRTMKRNDCVLSLSSFFPFFFFFFFCQREYKNERKNKEIRFRFRHFALLL